MKTEPETPTVTLDASELRKLRATIQQLEAERDRAYSMLEIYGVTRERAKSVDNGIDVLAIRLRRETATAMGGIELLEAERDRLREGIAEAIETIKVFHGPIAWDIYYNNAPEMKRFRALSAQDSKQEGG